MKTLLNWMTENPGYLIRFDEKPVTVIDDHEVRYCTVTVTTRNGQGKMSRIVDFNEFNEDTAADILDWMRNEIERMGIDGKQKVSDDVADCGKLSFEPGDILYRYAFDLVKGGYSMKEFTVHQVRKDRIKATGLRGNSWFDPNSRNGVGGVTRNKGTRFVLLDKPDISQAFAVLSDHLNQQLDEARQREEQLLEQIRVLEVTHGLFI